MQLSTLVNCRAVSTKTTSVVCVLARLMQRKFTSSASPTVFDVHVQVKNKEPAEGSAKTMKSSYFYLLFSCSIPAQPQPQPSPYRPSLSERQRNQIASVPKTAALKGIIFLSRLPEPLALPPSRLPQHIVRSSPGLPLPEGRTS